jgi:hypothetical protein
LALRRIDGVVGGPFFLRAKVRHERFFVVMNALVNSCI